MLRTLVMVLCLASAGSAGALDSILTTVSGNKVFLPAPVGMEPVNVDAFRRANPEAFVQPKMRLLAAFVPLGSSVSAPAATCAIVMVTDPPTGMTSDGITRIAATLRKNTGTLIPELLAKSNRALAEAKGKSAVRADALGSGIRIVGLSLHKQLLETPAFLLFTSYIEGEIELNGRPEIIFRPAGMGMGNLYGFGVYFYFLGEFGTSADDPGFVATTKHWTNAVMRGNALPMK